MRLFKVQNNICYVCLVQQMFLKLLPKVSLIPVEHTNWCCHVVGSVFKHSGFSLPLYAYRNHASSFEHNSHTFFLIASGWYTQAQLIMPGVLPRPVQINPKSRFHRSWNSCVCSVLQHVRPIAMFHQPMNPSGRNLLTAREPGTGTHMYTCVRLTLLPKQK